MGHAHRHCRWRNGGALLALEASGAWIRWLFVIYLLATVADCYLRAGFMTPPSRRVIPTVPHELTVGGIIGLIASFSAWVEA
jgi:uncharacterized membrane protein YfcA